MADRIQRPAIARASKNRPPPPRTFPSDLLSLTRQEGRKLYHFPIVDSNFKTLDDINDKVRA